MNEIETLQETLNRFINKGVHQTKIITTNSPSVVIWSKTRKCLVGGKDQPNSLEVIDDGMGNLRATYDNNIFISLQIILFPHQFPILPWLSSIFSMAKWLFGGIVLWTFILSLGLFIRQLVQSSRTGME